MSEEIKPESVQSYTLMTGEVYDLIYDGKDYALEAQKVTEIVSAYCESGGRDMLDIACGTGAHMQHLRSNFQVDGVDLSAEQVASARVKFPDARIEQSDMSSFDMGKKYDAIVCLFSSIGYLQTKERLDQTIAVMASHLKPGGVVIVEPWLKSEDLREGNVSIEANSKNGLHVVRMGTISREGIVTTSKMHHMIVRDHGEVEHFLEVHQLAMYSDADFEDAFTKAGLAIEIDPEGLTGRRLCIGKKEV